MFRFAIDKNIPAFYEIVWFCPVLSGFNQVLSTVPSKTQPCVIHYGIHNSKSVCLNAANFDKTIENGVVKSDCLKSGMVLAVPGVPLLIIIGPHGRSVTAR